MSAPGCGRCYQGWLGPNTDGRLVACPDCRPGVLEYLQRWGRAEPTRVLYEPRAQSPHIPMPPWFRTQVRGLQIGKTITEESAA